MLHSWRRAMPELSPGWATDLAVLELSGSLIEDRGDVRVVRSPDNPMYHWGNCLFVADPASVNDADRWAALFAAEFPSATWIAIGLVTAPDDTSAWERLGIAVELDDVLVSNRLPAQTPAPDGYYARALRGTDWEQSVRNALAENALTERYEPVMHEQFARARNATCQKLIADGLGEWFGAFTVDGDRLVADLGIVMCGPRLARYRSVGTDAGHRRRGLAAHLLGVAGSWAASRGAEEWVIMTEAVNPAGRVYRRAGFAPVAGNAQAYRAPAT
jgi:GNAT superfamily N-acetyltransferase